MRLTVSFLVYTVGGYSMETVQRFDGYDMNEAYSLFFQWITSISWEKYRILNYKLENLVEVDEEDY